MASIRRGEISQARLEHNRRAKSASQTARIEAFRAEQAACKEQASKKAAEITGLLRSGKITPEQAVKML